jgi:hypothetical protein
LTGGENVGVSKETIIFPLFISLRLMPFEAIQLMFPKREPF